VNLSLAHPLITPILPMSLGLAIIKLMHRKGGTTALLGRITLCESCAAAWPCIRAIGPSDAAAVAERETP